MQSYRFPTPLACRWLGLAAEHPGWSLANHHRFLPSFRNAVHPLLLLAGCGSNLTAGRSAGNGSALGTEYSAECSDSEDSGSGSSECSADEGRGSGSSSKEPVVESAMAAPSEQPAVGGTVAADGKQHPSGEPGMAGLASLPRDVLLHIVGLAAYPLSAWAPLDAEATQEVMDANGWHEQELW